MQGRAPNPILKWAGGKRGVLPKLIPFFPSDAAERRYIEPFFGAGAVFFKLQPKCAVIGDSNPELCTVYAAVQAVVEEVIEDLQLLSDTHKGAEGYYAARARFNAGAMSLSERAALFIYLNHTCFNGLYRVNRKGGFNVPYGKYKNPRICDPEGLRAASAALQGAHLIAGDFARTEALARPGDLIYFDPPYAPVSETSRFTSYTRAGFDGKDQIRLAKMFRRLDARGCLLVLSNSDAQGIRDLYEGFDIHEIQAPRAVGASAESRGEIGELIITNIRAKDSV